MRTDTDADGRPGPPSLRRYAVALGLVALATLGRALVDPLIGPQVPFAFHFVAVIVAARSGGLDAGLLAVVGSALAAGFFFLPPQRSLLISGADLAATLMFVGVGAALAWLVSRWTAAEHSLNESQAELRRRAERLEFHAMLLQHAYDAMFVKDAEQRITIWNRGAEELYGWRAEEAIGQNAHRLLGTAPAVERAMRDALSHAGVWSGRIEHRRKDGRAVISDSRQVVVGHDVLEINRDITDRENAERSARESQKLLETTMQNFPTVIAFKDREGRFVDVNPAVEKALGLPKAQIIGRTIADFVPAEAADVLHRHEREVMEARRAMQFEEQTPLPTGTLYHLNTNFPLIDARGEVYGTGHISHDITGQRRAEDDLREKAQALEHANRLKDEFLATLSHELRTPVNAILGWARMLAQGVVAPARVPRAIELIARNAEQQARLVEDILDVSRIMTGSFRLEMETVDVNVAIEQALDSLRLAADAKQLAITARVDPGLMLLGDRLRVQQVIWNLLSNAVKFTPPGGAITVTARHVAGSVEIAVADTGVGIRAEFLPHVFDRFTQADPSLTRAYTGLGLGLAIVRHIVELHGGTVVATSEGEGRGAVFTVALPLGTAGPVNVPGTSPAADKRPVA